MCDGDDDAWVSLGAIAARVMEKMAAPDTREGASNAASCHSGGRTAVILEWKARPRRDGSRSGGDDRRVTANIDYLDRSIAHRPLVAPARTHR